MSRSNSTTDARAVTPATLRYGALERLAGYHLRRAHARFFAQFAERFVDFAITPGQLGLLLMIDANPGVSQTALARAVGVERSTLGESIDKFQERSLVERRGSVVDRRSHALYLTAAGTAFVQGVLPTVEAHEETMLSALSPADRATLVQLLARIAGDDSNPLEPHR